MIVPAAKKRRPTKLPARVRPARKRVPAKRPPRPTEFVEFPPASPRVVLEPLPSPPSLPRLEPGRPRDDLRRDLFVLLPILVVLLLLHVLTAVLLRYPPFILLGDLRFFLVPTVLAAVVVGGLRTRLTGRARLIVAAALATLAALGLMAGGFFHDLVAAFFRDFFPMWAALVVPGPGRYRWKPTQMVGLALLLLPAWRSLYYGLGDLYGAVTPGGVAPTIPLLGLYRTFGLKTLREILLPIVGLFLLLGRFPWAQKWPQWKDDWLAILTPLQARLRRGLAWDLLWGAALFNVVALGAQLLQQFLTQFETLDTGDDSQVFVRITPDLVLLLSLAAGIGEEIVFRGLLQPFLTRALRDLRFFAFPLALFLQALFFGLVHAGYGNLIHVLLPFAFGLAMGLVLRYFGLLPCILIHVEIDVIAFSFDAAKSDAWVGLAADALLLVNFAAGVVLVVYGIYRLVMSFERRRTSRRAPPPPGDSAS